MSDYMAVMPLPTNASRPFWDACNRGELLLPECKACGNLFYYPRIACPRCGSSDLGWQCCAGDGAIFSFSHVRMSFFGPAWNNEIPYTVVLIDLDEGVRILSRLVGDDRDRAAIGVRVRLDFQTVNGQRLPFFQLSNGAAQVAARATV